MHYLIFDLDLVVNVPQNIAQYPLHHVTYAPENLETAMSNGSWGDEFTRKCIIWFLILTLWSMSHKTLPSTLYIMWPMHLKTLKLLCPMVHEEMNLQENALFDFWSWPCGQCPTKHCPVPSTSCDLCTCKVWRCNVQQFRRCIFKKIHYLTFDQRSNNVKSRSHETLHSTLYFMWTMHLQSLNMLCPMI